MEPNSKIPDLTHFYEGIGCIRSKDYDKAEKVLLQCLSSDINFYPTWVALCDTYFEKELYNWSFLCYLKAKLEYKSISSTNYSSELVSLFRDSTAVLESLKKSLENLEWEVILDEESLVDMRLQLSKKDPLCDLIEEILKTKDSRYITSIGGVYGNEDEDMDFFHERSTPRNLPQPIIIQLPNTFSDNFELILKHLNEIKLELADVQVKLNQLRVSTPTQSKSKLTFFGYVKNIFTKF